MPPKKAKISKKPQKTLKKTQKNPKKTLTKQYQKKN
jgi:hypothetical protein